MLPLKGEPVEPDVQSERVAPAKAGGLRDLDREMVRAQFVFRQYTDGAPERG